MYKQLIYINIFRNKQTQDQAHADKVIALNKFLNSAAEKDGLIYVDYYSAMINDQNGMKQEYSGDGVQPNEAGYKAMEPLVEDAIAKALH